MRRSGPPWAGLVGAWAAAVLLASCGGDAAAPLGPDTSGPCIFPNALCRDRLDVAGGVMLPYYRTHDLDSLWSGVRRAVVVIHGTNRDADAYFETMVVATADGRVRDETVVVSPNFQTRSDGPGADEAYWTSSGWKRGNLSEPGGPEPRVSSYEALDRLVGILADRTHFPDLEEIIVTGHSAGGQVVHRYAATGRAEEAVTGVRVRYVVANPSTWLYIGPERVAGAGFRVPDGGGCPDYDDWHYGLQDRNAYAGALAADTIRAWLVRRDVTVLVGDADTGTNLLDVSCGANLQGPNRYERGRTLVRYMDAEWPGHRHRLSVVPGVGHSSRSMYTSDAGLQALFGG